MTAKPHHNFQHFLTRLPSVKTVRIEGMYYRLIPALRAQAIAETGGSFEFGGRFNPPNVFGGLYVSETALLAWSEIVKYYQGRLELIPGHVLGDFELDITKTLDLTDSATRSALDIDVSDITDATDRRVTQWMGHAAWMMGIEAIKYPSSPLPERFNIVVFVDQLSAASRIIKRSVHPFKPPQ